MRSEIPSQQGSASNSLSESEIADLLVKAGRNLCLIMFSIGERNLPVPGVVLMA